MKTRFLPVLVYAAALAAGSCSLAHAHTWHLESDGSGDFPTIQAALDASAPGDTIELACGTYYEHDLTVPFGITLRSVAGSAGCATIDAQALGRVIDGGSPPGELVLEGVTLTHGRLSGSSDRGAGLRFVGGSLTVRRCAFLDNYAEYSGGGLSLANCRAQFADCRIAGNSGVNGGGGGLRGYRVSGTFSHCDFDSNQGIDGAGIFLDDSSPSIEYCTFRNNDGWFFGGGAFLQADASPTFDHCTFVGNEAYFGAGIMTAAHAAPTVTNSIVAFNLDGAGIHCDDGVSSPSYLYISCSDVFGNAGGGYTGWLTDQTGLNGNIAENPLFCDLPGGDLELAADSPCLPENNSCAELIGALGQGCAALAVETEETAGEDRLIVRPNPTVARATMAFELGEVALVELTVIGVDGRRLATLYSGSLAAGRHTIPWDGRDERGVLLPAGTYFVRLARAEGIVTTRFQLLR